MSEDSHEAQRLTRRPTDPRDPVRITFAASAPLVEKSAPAMSQAEAEVEAMADAVIDAIRTVVGPVDARVKLLEAEREYGLNAPPQKAAGEWKIGTTYDIGDVISYSGDLWACTATHVASGPAVDRSYWKRFDRKAR